MKIVLPWPDKRLTPNAKRRKHWSVYRPATKSDRLDAHLLTIEALQQQGCYPPKIRPGPIPMTVTFYPPDRRQRDDDGMIGAFKAMRDGVADGLHVDDRRFRPQYVIGEPEKPGRVEIEFSPGPASTFQPAGHAVSGMSPTASEAA